MDYWKIFIKKNGVEKTNLMIIIKNNYFERIGFTEAQIGVNRRNKMKTNLNIAL